MSTPKTPPAPTAPPEPASMPPLEGRNRLSPAQVEMLNRTYADVVLADDDDAKALKRRIVARLRRCAHDELHPGCQRVILDVPQLPTGHFVQINERTYIGRCEVWLCEAQTILQLVHQARTVEDARMREDGQARPQNLIDLDRGGLAARARAIQDA
jgi:hypothetical protein